MTSQRLAVQRVGEQRLLRQCLLAQQAAAVLLIDFVLLRAELDFFLPMIGAEEDELPRPRFHACLVEHGMQRYTGPTGIARETLQRTPVARALEAGDELGPAHAAKRVERQ